MAQTLLQPASPRSPRRGSDALREQRADGAGLAHHTRRRAALLLWIRRHTRPRPGAAHAQRQVQQRVADEGLQLHGGAGFMDEYPISRQSADAKIATIYAGSSEIMKLIIGRHCLGDTYDPFNQRNF